MVSKESIKTLRKRYFWIPENSAQKDGYSWETYVTLRKRLSEQLLM